MKVKINVSSREFEWGTREAALKQRKIEGKDVTIRPYKVRIEIIMNKKERKVFTYLEEVSKKSFVVETNLSYDRGGMIVVGGTSTEEADQNAEKIVEELEKLCSEVEKRMKELENWEEKSGFFG